MTSLGDLWRSTGYYKENEALTHEGDHVVASELQMRDAVILSQSDTDKRGIEYWLTMILCKDNRIPFTPYDEEEIST